MSHTLFVVATPIGNLEDLTFRALRVLKEVDLIAAEDTRKARVLLSAHGIRKPLVSYHKFSEKSKLPLLLEALEHKDVALVSEAGTPGISDPGRYLVQAARQRGIPVVVVPGPSAVLAALVASGLPADQFLFVGFLPRRKGERRRLLGELASQPRTAVAFEAPHRLRETLADAQELLGDRPIAIGREMTKVYEELFAGTAAEALAHFAQPRGEFTLVFLGSSGSDSPGPSENELLEALRDLKAQGLPARAAVPQVARALGLSRKEVYRNWLALGVRAPGKPASKKGRVLE